MEKASKMNPANLKNMDNLATAYLQLGRQEDTERVLRATLAQNPSHATAHNVFGNLEIQRGRVLEARKHFEQAIEYDRDLAEPYVNLGLIAQNAGNSQAAISYYRSFLKKADKDKHRDYIPKVKAALADLGATP
jgi:protein O-GlcNAc transferase